MGFLSPNKPPTPPMPKLPKVAPDPPIKSKDTKATDREERRLRRKSGLRQANVTGGLGLLTTAPTTKKTLLGQ
jgi:hypothetical protein